MEEERRLCYVGITRAQKVLYITRAKMRMLYNQTNFNAPSRFLSEIPERLLEDENATLSGRFGSQPGGMNRPRTTGAYGSAPRSANTAPPPSPYTKPSAYGQPARKPVGLNIPGVQKGFGSAAPTVSSAASSVAAGALQNLYKPGDRVRHPKFGEGVVESVDGARGRIRISFTAFGAKELSLSIAPIIKLED